MRPLGPSPKAPGGARGSLEVDLLLAAARTDAAQATASRVRELAARKPHWPRVMELAATHGVQGLLSRSFTEVEAAGGLLVPRRVSEAVRSRHRRVARANLRLTVLLHRILDAFEEEGIPVIPYKGPVLASRAYGDVSLRTFSDLDLMVREETLQEAQGVLARAGLVRDLGSAPVPDRALLRWSNALTFRDRDGTSVELHWRLSDPAWRMRISMPEIWRRARLHPWTDREVLGLSTEDQIHLLCLHAARHAWSRLIWMADVAETLRAEAVDWDALCGIAEETGTLRMVRVGVGLAHRLLGAPLEEEVLDRIRADPRADGLADHVEGLLRGGEVWAGREFLFHLRSRERLRDRLAFLAAAAFNPTIEDFRGVAPGAPLWPRRFLRPFRLARKYWDQRRRAEGWTWEREG